MNWSSFSPLNTKSRDCKAWLHNLIVFGPGILLVFIFWLPDDCLGSHHLVCIQGRKNEEVEDTSQFYL